MPIVELPNGEVAFVEDGATPETIARIKAANTGKPKQPRTSNAPAKLAPFEQNVQSRLAQGNKFDNSSGLSKFNAGSSALTGRFTHGITFGADDPILAGASAITRGAYKAVKNHDIGEIGKEYTLEREVLKRKRQRDDGLAGTALEFAGAVANPLGAGETALKWAGGLSPKLSKLTALGEKVENAPAIVQALMAGGNQGALEAGFNGENVGTGYTSGAIGGTLFGGALHGGRRIKQIFSDRTPEAASRTAYSRIATLLNHNKMSPEQAAMELRRSSKAGNDAMVMDLSPGLRATGAALSRKPNLERSNELIQRGEERIDARPGRFEDQIRDAIKPGTGQDADTALDSIRGAQRATGKADYERVLDGKFIKSDDMDAFLRSAPDEVQRALRDGVKLAELYGQDIGKLGVKLGPNGEVLMDAAPSMRVFDYAKRAMDDHIGSAFSSGNKSLAGGLSNQLTQFKKLIAEANPEYAGILATQRDFFQKANAVETGLDVIKRMKKEPKAVLKELNGLDASVREEARTGIVEAIIGLRSSHSDPVKFFRSVMRTPAQRKVFEFAFNGKGNLSRFEKWLSRETRAAKADVLTAPGRQSETARFDQADESLGGQASSVFQDVMRGFAYGGPAGAAAAGTRKFHDLRTGTGPAAQDEIARILLSNGIDLPKGVSAAERFQKARKEKNNALAIAAAKGGSQLFSGYGG